MCVLSLLVHVLFLNPVNSGYMDLKQKGDVLIAKTLAHLKAARFHLYRHLNVLPRKPDEIALLRLSIHHPQHHLLSSRIRMTH